MVHSTAVLAQQPSRSANRSLCGSRSRQAPAWTPTTAVIDRNARSHPHERAPAADSLEQESSGRRRLGAGPAGPHWDLVSPRHWQCRETWGRGDRFRPLLSPFSLVVRGA